jgi:hypothetical protein
MIKFIDILKNIILEDYKSERYPYVSRKIGNYIYKGFTKEQEYDVYNNIAKVFDKSSKEKIEIKSIPEYVNYIDTIYEKLVMHNPELKSIKTNLSKYDNFFPKHDIVYGAFSGIPPEDIKHFVEKLKGSGTNIKNRNLYDDTKQYISLKTKNN